MLSGSSPCRIASKEAKRYKTRNDSSHVNPPRTERPPGACHVPIASVLSPRTIDIENRWFSAASKSGSKVSTALDLCQPCRHACQPADTGGLKFQERYRRGNFEAEKNPTVGGPDVTEWQRGGGLAGGGDGDAEFLEFGAGLAVFFCSGITLDDLPEFADGVVLLAKLNERHAFPEARWGELEASWIVDQDFFVGGDGIAILFLLEGNLAEIELGVGSEVGVSVILEVVLEFGAGEIIFAAGDVAQTIRIERVRGRRGAAGGAARGWSCRSRSWSGGRSAAGDLGVQALHGVLKIHELL